MLKTMRILASRGIRDRSRAWGGNTPLISGIRPLGSTWWDEQHLRTRLSGPCGVRLANCVLAGSLRLPIQCAGINDRLETARAGRGRAGSFGRVAWWRCRNLPTAKTFREPAELNRALGIILPSGCLSQRRCFGRRSGRRSGTRPRMMTLPTFS